MSRKRIYRLILCASALLAGCADERADVSGRSTTTTTPPEQVLDTAMPLRSTYQDSAINLEDIKVVGVVLSQSNKNSALVKRGGLEGATLVTVGSEIKKGMIIVSIDSEGVAVDVNGVVRKIEISYDQPVNTKIPEQNTAQDKSVAVSKSLPLGMIPMAPDAADRPSANQEFREMIGRRFPQQ